MHVVDSNGPLRDRRAASGLDTIAWVDIDGVETTTADTKRDAFRVPTDVNIMLMDEFIDKHIRGALVCTGHYYNTQFSPIVLL